MAAAAAWGQLRFQTVTRETTMAGQQRLAKDREKVEQARIPSRKKNRRS